VRASGHVAAPFALGLIGKLVVAAFVASFDLAAGRAVVPAGTVVRKPHISC
jgi:hypothetical protein